MSNSGKKTSFILHHDSLAVIDMLTDEQAGQLLKAMKSFNVDGEVPKLDNTMEIVFLPFKNQFIRDFEKWEEIKLKRSEAGKRGRQKPPKNENETST